MNEAENFTASVEKVMESVDVEQHCETCASLNGTRHRMSWFVERDYIPQKPGAAMDCGGWRCQCTLVDTEGNQVAP